MKDTFEQDFQELRERVQNHMACREGQQCEKGHKSPILLISATVLAISLIAYLAL